jgi:hypothetical protein
VFCYWWSTRAGALFIDYFRDSFICGCIIMVVRVQGTSSTRFVTIFQHHWSVTVFLIWSCYTLTWNTMTNGHIELNTVEDVCLQPSTLASATGMMMVVWHFVSESHKVITALIVMFIFKFWWRFLCNFISMKWRSVCNIFSAPPCQRLCEVFVKVTWGKVFLCLSTSCFSMLKDVPLMLESLPASSYQC